MNHLIQGMEAEDEIKHLISMTKSTSDMLSDAMIDHLVIGHPEAQAAQLNSVSQSNFNRGLKRLNEVAEQIYQYNEMKRANQKSGKRKLIN